MLKQEDVSPEFTHAGVIPKISRGTLLPSPKWRNKVCLKCEAFHKVGDLPVPVKLFLVIGHLIETLIDQHLLVIGNILASSFVIVILTGATRARCTGSDPESCTKRITIGA
jgi:hypothetical protein